MRKRLSKIKKINLQISLIVVAALILGAIIYSTKYKADDARTTQFKHVEASK